MVQLWDTRGSKFRYSGKFDTVEAAAAEYDLIADVLNDNGPIDRNYPPIQSMAASTRRRGPVAGAPAAKRRKQHEDKALQFMMDRVYSALALIHLADRLLPHGLRVEATEVNEWRGRVKRAFIHSKPTAEDAAQFARELTWLGTRLKTEAMNYTWTKSVHDSWLKRCDECTEWGSELDYFHDNITDSMRWATYVITHGSVPKFIVCGQDTVAALIDALDTDAICVPALEQMRNGARYDQVLHARMAARNERERTLMDAELVATGKKSVEEVRKQQRVEEVRKQQHVRVQKGESHAANLLTGNFSG